MVLAKFDPEFWVGLVVGLIIASIYSFGILYPAIRRLMRVQVDSVFGVGSSGIFTKNRLMHMATEFSLGQPRFFNGEPLPSHVQLKDHHHYYLKKKGSQGWIILVGNNRCLNREGDIEPDKMSSNQDDVFLKRTRFSTPFEAFTFLKKWENDQIDAWQKKPKKDTSAEDEAAMAMRSTGVGHQPDPEKLDSQRIRRIGDT